MWNTLLLLGFLVCLFALIASFVWIKKQENHELDKGMNKTTIRHPILANPMLIMYVLFPIVIVLAFALGMVLFK